MGGDHLWEAIGAIGKIVGAAVVITLIYLAIQMRQNTASVKASAFQVWAGIGHLQRYRT